MSRKQFLTEEEFDKLSDYSQLNYLWCPECKLFYDVTNQRKHLCTCDTKKCK